MELSAYGCFIRGLVARGLLDCAEDTSTGRHRLSQRDLAEAIGVDLEMINMSLKSLQEADAIRIARHRMIINKDVLEEMAECAAANRTVSQE